MTCLAINIISEDIKREMKIVYLIPGSGTGFYCENCMRDIPLVNALKRQGVEVTMLPIYLPLFADQKNFMEDYGVFLGAVNLFLKYKYPFLQGMPKWLSRLLDSGPLLKLAARFSSSTEAGSLEKMTMDMLTGDMPYIAREIRELCLFLRKEIQPDIIHISNALLSGLGINIKHCLAAIGIKCRLVCTLQDEHSWLDEMSPAFRDKAWQTLQKQSTHIDRFFPVSRYYKDFMREKLLLADDHLQTVANGIDDQNYKDVVPAAEPPVIGYLSRVHSGYGLDVLAEAYLELKKKPALKDLKLRVMGGRTASDKKFLRAIQSKLKPYLKKGDVLFYKGFSLVERLDFFTDMTVLSVPMEEPEAFGIYLLEAMACGVPVVQPDIGPFSEIITPQSGLLYSPQEEGGLSRALEKILLSPEKTALRAKSARAHIKENFSLTQIAGKLKEHYLELVE